MAACTQSTDLNTPVITATKNGRLKRTRSFNGIDSDLLFEASQTKKPNRGRPKKDPRRDIGSGGSGGSGSGALEGKIDDIPSLRLRVKSNTSNTSFCDVQNIASDPDPESMSLTADANITLNELHAELKRQKSSISKLQNNVGKLSKTVTNTPVSDAERQLEQLTNLQSVVKLLADQVSFLLSYVGITDSSPLPSTTLPSQSSTNLLSSEPPRPSASSASYADLAKRPPAALQKTFQRSVVAAVYTDQQRRNNQTTNVVISGLPSHPQAADKTVVHNLLVDEFHFSLEIVKCRRLGRPSLGKIQPLLVILRSAADADRVMSCAKQLRNSPHVTIRDCVYINRHLTAAQSRAAFELRCSRRSARQVRSDPQRSQPGSLGKSRDNSLQTLPESRQPTTAVVSFVPTSLPVAPSIVTSSQWLPLTMSGTPDTVSVASSSATGISSAWLPFVQQSSTSVQCQQQPSFSGSQQSGSADCIPMFNYFAPLQQQQQSSQASGSCPYGYVGS